MSFGQSLVPGAALSYTARRHTNTVFSSFGPFDQVGVRREATAMQKLRQNICQVAPGQAGTKRLSAQYCAQLVCVGYREELKEKELHVDRIYNEA